MKKEERDEERRNQLITGLIERNRLFIRRHEDPNACPCYGPKGTKCHTTLNDYDLICLFCYCPNYIPVSENPEGGCKIDSKRGKWFYHESHPTGRIWDCTECDLMHREKYIRRHLESLSIEELRKLKM